MPPSKTRLPAIEGWFTLDDEAPALLGSRCTTCGNFAFPKETFFCRNPACQGKEFAETELSRTGTVWSYTDACYQPPKPYEAADPYVPFALAAVELVLDTLYEDDENEYLVWKWKPVAGRPAEPAGGAGRPAEPAGGAGDA